MRDKLIRNLSQAGEAALLDTAHTVYRVPALWSHFKGFQLQDIHTMEVCGVFSSKFMSMAINISGIHTIREVVRETVIRNTGTDIPNSVKQLGHCYPIINESIIVDGTWQQFADKPSPERVLVANVGQDIAQKLEEGNVPEVLRTLWEVGEDPRIDPKALTLLGGNNDIDDER